MVPKPIGVGAYRLLEWGPPEERRSTVFDYDDRMIFTGSRVTRVERAVDGVVVKLISDRQIEVLWKGHTHPVVIDAITVRVNKKRVTSRTTRR